MRILLATTRLTVHYHAISVWYY